VFLPLISVSEETGLYEREREASSKGVAAAATDTNVM
jgi:hypothetical protein